MPRNVQKPRVTANISGGKFHGVDVVCRPLQCNEYLPNGTLMAFSQEDFWKLKEN